MSGDEYDRPQSRHQARPSPPVRQDSFEISAGSKLPLELLKSGNPIELHLQTRCVVPTDPVTKDVGDFAARCSVENGPYASQWASGAGRGKIGRKVFSVGVETPRAPARTVMWVKTAREWPGVRPTFRHEYSHYDAQQSHEPHSLTFGDPDGRWPKVT